MDTEEDAPMSATEVPTTFIDTESDKVERWRAEALERAGYDPSTAALLAIRSDVDLHQATELVEHGCSPELALRILL
jgi:hypothetical protein